jgi:hypothetical protein
MTSKQDFDTDCGCCFCLRTLKSYNAPQLCSGWLNQRFATQNGGLFLMIRDSARLEYVVCP